MLELKDLHKTFNPGTVNAKTALDGLSLTLWDGSRLVMLHEGRVILDISGEEKENLTVSDLLAQFARVSGDEFASDRALLS